MCACAEESLWKSSSRESFAKSFRPERPAPSGARRGLIVRVGGGAARVRGEGGGDGCAWEEKRPRAKSITPRAKLTCEPQEFLAAVVTIITSLLPRFIHKALSCNQKCSHKPDHGAHARAGALPRHRVWSPVSPRCWTAAGIRDSHHAAKVRVGARRQVHGALLAALWPRSGRVRHPSTRTQGARLPVNQHSHERLPTGLEALVAFGSGWWQRAQFCLVPTSCTK